MLKAREGKNIKHGQSKSKFYSTFERIKSRCNSEGATNYKNYGGRGIKVEWKSFEEFRDDMYESYLKHVEEYGGKETTIDRVDVDGNYCKENCRWATWKEQNNNQQKHKKGKADLARLKGKQYCFGCNKVKTIGEFYKKKYGINNTSRLCKPCYIKKYYQPTWKT